MWVASATTSYGQTIYPIQFADQNHRVDSHGRQPRATQFNEKIDYATAKLRPNPAQAAAAQSEHDPDARPSARWSGHCAGRCCGFLTKRGP